MKANETREDYVKRCMIYSQDVNEKSAITKIPKQCLENEESSCYASSPCDKDDDDCVEFGDAFKTETVENSDQIIDPCSKNDRGYSWQGVISDLPSYLAGLEAKRPVVGASSNRKARRS